jgi:hypothetical protein
MPKYGIWFVLPYGGKQGVVENVQMDNFILTDKQRKKSNVKGTGIQYLPGHKDQFVDFCANSIKKSKKNNLKILEIGGGGLRFVASILRFNNVEKIYIVEPDYFALDYKKIFEMTKLDSDCFKLFKRKCTSFICEFDEFVEFISNKIKFDYIVSLRVFHFFSLKNFVSISKKTSELLQNNGELFISGVSWRDNNTEHGKNLLYANSVPLGGNNNYRKIDFTHPDIAEEKKRQNLRNKMLFFDRDFLDSIFNTNDLHRVGKSYVSSRIVNGYVYKKAKI